MDSNSNVAQDFSIVCRCKAVKYKTVKEAILNGATTLEEIKKQTKANSGCGKSCTEKLLEMIEKYSKQK